MDLSCRWVLLSYWDGSVYPFVAGNAGKDVVGEKVC
jgi:hypothetical protein